MIGGGTNESHDIIRNAFALLIGMEEIRVTHTVTQSHIVTFFRSVTTNYIITLSQLT